MDAGPVRAHLQRLVASGLLQSYLADEAGVPRTTVHDLLHSSRRISAPIAEALLALRPLDVEAALPARVALADSTGSRSGRSGVVAGLDLQTGSVRDAAAALGVSTRTVERWRARQASGRRSA